MELILKSNNEQSIAKIISLAKKLHVVVEKRDTDTSSNSKNAIKERILNFKAALPASFGDAGEWQNEQRQDRELPFS